MSDYDSSSTPAAGIFFLVNVCILFLNTQRKNRISPYEHHTGIIRISTNLD